MPWKREDGRWSHQERWAPGPKGRVTGYGSSPEEAVADAVEKAARARAAAEDAERETSAGRTPIPTYRDFPDGSFARFVWQTWWPHVLPGLTKPSRRKYNSLLKHHVLPALGKLPIAEIGYAEVKAMMDGVRRRDKRGTPLSAKQKWEILARAKEVLELHRKLRQATGEHARDDWRIVTTATPPAKKKRQEPPADFTQKLLAACEPWEMGPHFMAAILALRRGEVCGLKKDKIDRVKLTITVSEQLQPETGALQVPVKGGEDRVRTIPITPEILAAIDKFADPESEYVFTAPRPGKGRHRKGYAPPMAPILPNQLSKWTPAICARAGLPKSTFHDVRAYAASNLAALGVGLIEIMEILGHTDVDTTLIYASAKNEIKRAGLRKLLDSLQKEQTDVAAAVDGRA